MMVKILLLIAQCDTASVLSWQKLENEYSWLQIELPLRTRYSSYSNNHKNKLNWIVPPVGGPHPIPPPVNKMMRRKRRKGVPPLWTYSVNILASQIKVCNVLVQPKLGMSMWSWAKLIKIRRRLPNSSCATRRATFIPLSQLMVQHHSNINFGVFVGFFGCTKASK